MLKDFNYIKMYCLFPRSCSLTVVRMCRLNHFSDKDIRPFTFLLILVCPSRYMSLLVYHVLIRKFNLTCNLDSGAIGG